MIYTGIGSRETPHAVQARIIQIAHRLGEAGWTLRSGGAEGADAAFEHGAGLVKALGPYPNMEVYLPWRGFNGRPKLSPPFFWEIPVKAFKIAEQVHPDWMVCTDVAKKLHARNVCQIIGQDLNTPSDAVVCWTLDGVKRGGTRTALVIARRLTIPIWNLADEEHREKSAEQIADEVRLIGAEARA